jgi:predicted nucleotidyltransferase
MVADIGDNLRLQELVNLLRAYGPQRVILFGSYARGEQDRYSDVDIVIIKETRQRFLERLRAVYEHVCPDYALDVLVYTPEEFARMVDQGNSLIERVQKEGVVLYEQA